MIKTFVAFALSDSMADEYAVWSRCPLSSAKVKDILKEPYISAVNKSHAATIAALKTKFGIDVEIPSTPPTISLYPGDRLIVMSVIGLPRLTDRHEYTHEEIANAAFRFGLWEIGGVRGDII